MNVPTNPPSSQPAGENRPPLRLAATVMLVRPGSAGFEVFLVRRSAGSAFAPGAYVFPGGAVDPQDASIAHAALRELREEAGVALNHLEALTRFSHWITPPGESRRFDTHFFLARLPDGQEAQADANETHEGVWLTPAQALTRHHGGTLHLVYPTIKHLERLARFTSIDALFDFARAKPIVTISPEYSAGTGYRIPEHLEQQW